MCVKPCTERQILILNSLCFQMPVYSNLWLKEARKLPRFTNWMSFTIPCHHQDYGIKYISFTWYSGLLPGVIVVVLLRIKQSKPHIQPCKPHGWQDKTPIKQDIHTLNRITSSSWKHFFCISGALKIKKQILVIYIVNKLSQSIPATLGLFQYSTRIIFSISLSKNALSCNFIHIFLYCLHFRSPHKYYTKIVSVQMLHPRNEALHANLKSMKTHVASSGHLTAMCSL